MVEGALSAPKNRGRAPLPGRPRFADRPAQPAPLPRQARPPTSPSPPLRRPGRGDGDRHRRPEGGQRPARPPRRRQPDPPRSPTTLRERVRGDRHRRPALRRRVRGADAADRRRRARCSSARTCGPGGRRLSPATRSWPGRRSASGSRCSGAEPTAGAEAVLVAADEAMYRAKEEGRNRIALFEAPARRATGDAPQPDDLGAGSATPSPRTASASPRSRSAASPTGGSSATSCCCGCRRRRRAAARLGLHRASPSAPG